MLNVIMLSCIMLSCIMLSVIMLNVIMLNVIMPSAGAPRIYNIKLVRFAIKQDKCVADVRALLELKKGRD